VVETEKRAYFSPRHVCAAIGLTWQGQSVKIAKDNALMRARHDFVTIGRDGGRRNTTMLPLELLSGWLFMVNPNMVSPSVKPKLLKYRTETFAVLDAWFRKNARALLVASAAIARHEECLKALENNVKPDTLKLVVHRRVHALIEC